MNKFGTVLFLMIFLTLITLVAGSITMTTSTDIIGGIIVSEDVSILNSFGLLGTFWKILTFQINEIPEWITVLVFYPITLGTIILIVDTIFGR